MYHIHRSIVRNHHNLLSSSRRQFSSCVLHNDTHKILMPALSPTMTVGTIKQWLKKEGDFLEPGEVLCMIDTDKATIDMEIVEQGYLAKIVVPDQTANVPLGKLIALMVDEKGEKPDLSMLNETTTATATTTTPSATPATTTAPKSTPVPEKSTATLSNRNKAEYKIPMPPSVSLLLANNPWINPFDIKATGKGGRLLKGDVLQYLKENKPTAGAAQQPATKPQPQQQQKQPTPQQQATTAGRPPKQQYSDVETTQMRKIIASRLLESKTTIPHLYISVEAQIDSLLRAKSQLLKVRGSKVSVNDFVIYAASRALEEFPQCNAVLNKKTGTHEVSQSIDISFAVATEKGLLTPIIKNANTLSVEQIAKHVKDLSERARASKLKPEEFQGGSFCISNLGMFGITHFSAVINPPQAIIVAVGGSEKKPIFNKVDLDSDVYEDNISLDSVQSGTFMSLTASVDRSAVDDATAGQFMQAFKRNLEEILLM